MYCKHCGKEIADDSKYCQHCGDSQSQESKLEFNGLFASFVKNKKIWLIYLIWLLINFVIFISGNIQHCDIHPQRAFFPFPLPPVSRLYESCRYDWFDIDSYDFSEFMVYCIIIPLIVYWVITYKDNIFKKERNNSEISRKE